MAGMTAVRAMLAALAIVAFVGCGTEQAPSSDNTTTTARASSTTALSLPQVVTTAAPKGLVGTVPPATDPPDTDPPETSPPKTSPPTPSVYYSSCADAKAAGAAPLYRGDPGYRSGLDRDNDGVACET